MAKVRGAPALSCVHKGAEFSSAGSAAIWLVLYLCAVEVRKLAAHFLRNLSEWLTECLNFLYLHLATEQLSAINVS